MQHWGTCECWTERSEQITFYINTRILFLKDVGTLEMAQVANAFRGCSDYRLVAFLC